MGRLLYQTADSNRGRPHRVPTQPSRWRNPAPATAALASQSSFETMGHVDAPVVLLDPRGVSGSDSITQCSRTDDLITDAFASADTSVLLPGAKFGFQLRGGTLVLQVLHTSRLQMPDEWGVRPIQFFVELLCTHRKLVLFRLSSTDIGSPTEFFVYSFPFGKGTSATVVKLPEVSPKLWASESFGLVRHKSECDKYVVANLQRQFNPETGCVDAFLHRWFCNDLSWRSERVTLPSVFDMGKWQTDKVITFANKEFNYLLWVDLSLGVILRCNNPLQANEANFNIIYLPYSKGIPRPQTFMSVGCCNGELKLGNIDISDANTVYVTIMTFDELSYKKFSNEAYWKKSYKKFSNEAYWKRTTRFPLKCTELWTAMKNLPALKQVPSYWEVSENHMPCFSVLSTLEGNIIYLIVARKDNTGAWLLMVNTESYTLVDAADYPGFRNHKKPPYS